MTRARSNDPVVWERRKEDRREKRRKHKQKLDAKKMQDLQSEKNEDAEMHDGTGVMITSRHPAAASMPPQKLRSEPKRVDKRKGVRERMKRRTAISKDAAAEENAARKAVWKDYVKNQKTKARDRKENSNNGGEVGQQGEGKLIFKFIGATMKDANQASGENGDGMNSAGGLMFAGLAFRPKV
ncbi:hypothetical protein BELL_0725g00040 [Botrytis elliptica]|uniref:Uncharacterized protein n=1 Tax=Botrytis elliptica TaxID=278938 RepID=A0A4Z1JM94_9HELO|nr:hypothetical protein EAE99_009839 [Botrytis elliptica]TGO70443.1 hypothetical protein BELL_0725g00040 [Botrytis elliptica]